MSFYWTSVVNTPMLMVFFLFSLCVLCLAVRSGPEPWSCRSCVTQNLCRQIMSVCWPEDACVFLYENLSLHALDNVITRLGEI